MELPIACSLDPDALKARREGLLSELFQRADEQVELPSGRRFRFAARADTLTLIAQAVEAERLCCRFLRFDIIVEPDAGPIWLELSGPPGTAEFVVSLLSP